MDATTYMPTTPAGIARRLDAAGILVRRWAGCWIDLITLAVVLFGPALAVGAGFRDAAAYVMWLDLALVLFYFPVTEGLWGRSLGKLITGTIVVGRDGRPPGLLKATLRTITRLVEVNPFLLGGIPAGLIVLFSKDRQRLGDMWAETYVIPLKDLKRVGAVTAEIFA